MGAADEVGSETFILCSLEHPKMCSFVTCLVPCKKVVYWIDFIVSFLIVRLSTPVPVSSWNFAPTGLILNLLA